MKKRRIKGNNSDKNNRVIKNNKSNKKKNINWKLTIGIIIIMILILLILAIFKLTGKTIDYEKLVSSGNSNENDNNILEFIKQGEDTNTMPEKLVITGNIINSEKFICSDTDGGKNYEVKGIISQGRVDKGTDNCTSDTRLKEYYCLTRTSTIHYYYNCPYKCLDGKCIEN